MKTKLNAWALFLVCFLALVGAVSAQTNIDAGLQTVITGAGDTFTAVKAVIIAIVLFMLGLKVAKMLRRA